MAAGLSLEEENVPLMRERLNELTTLEEEDFIPKIMIDVPMPLDYITPELVKELSVLEPFGKGNEKPLFADKGIQLLSARVLGKNRNVCKMKVKSSFGRTLEAVYFGDIEAFKNYVAEKFDPPRTEALFRGETPSEPITMSFVYYPEINRFNGRETLQLVVKNYC